MLSSWRTVENSHTLWCVCRLSATVIFCNVVRFCQSWSIETNCGMRRCVLLLCKLSLLLSCGHHSDTHVCMRHLLYIMSVTTFHSYKLRNMNPISHKYVLILWKEVAAWQRPPFFPRCLVLVVCRGLWTRRWHERHQSRACLTKVELFR